ncbi:hypothetical protein GCM10007863_44010 [Dyella mobilis]|nr:hypothetical protein [Dyella mobilis]GLQ99981.1 hypothetical protein GCM10007863_44010 [Dyella mobilis]
MTFETMMLRSLFGACVLVCGLLLAAIISARPVPAHWAGDGVVNAAAIAAAVPATRDRSAA